jgi:hypothetical protein
MTRATRRFFLLAIAVWAIGTTGAPRAAETRNRLAANRLAANRLAANRLAANRLAANALSSTKLEANMATADILATAGGRDVYAYLVSCALPGEVSIQAAVPGAEDAYCTGGTCTFPGGLGLADYWVDHKLNPEGQRWVTACVLARVNLYEQAEGISLRGAHDSLIPSPTEVGFYTLEEGAFFGNIFSDGTELDWNACRGRDKREWGRGSGSGGSLGMRDCTWPDPEHPGKTLCGFNYAGDCASFTDPPEPYSCKNFESGANGLYEFYDGCHVAPGDGRWNSLKTYRQVITSYVVTP